MNNPPHTKARLSSGTVRVAAMETLKQMIIEKAVDLLSGRRGIDRDLASTRSSGRIAGHIPSVEF
jgi:hypothetical protein